MWNRWIFFAFWLSANWILKFISAADVSNADSLHPTFSPTRVPTPSSYYDLSVPLSRSLSDSSSSPTLPASSSPTLAVVNNVISHLNYGNNEDLTWYYPPSSGTVTYVIHFTVSQMEAGYDYLLYGPTTVGPRTKCVNSCSDQYVTSSTGLTFSFHSDSSYTYAGFSLTIIPGGTFSPTPTPGKYNHVYYNDLHLVILALLPLRAN